MTKAILNRMPDEGKQTRGILSILEDGIEIFQCVTLELGWKKTGVMCLVFQRVNILLENISAQNLVIVLK